MDDLYAAYCLKIAADEYKFGRAADEPTRRQTRFLFYMAVIELLKGVMVRAKMTVTNRTLTQALLKLFKPESEDIIKELLDAGVGLIDEYMTQGTEDCIFDEPAVVDKFNNDVGGYLKSEQLGKKESSPHFQNQLGSYQKFLGKAGKGGTPSLRDRIVTAIK